MGLGTFYGKGPHRLLRAGSRAARRQIAVSGIPNCLNCCVIFIVYTQFRNVAAGRIIQDGGPRDGDPWSKAYACSPSIAGIVSSNPAEGMVIRLLCLLCVV
jgi:hypothetical protein